ncbi:DUF6864 domain-containing function [Pseudomonas sp. RIT623]|uniref:DUF6864 domain-containing function n=1 Tax=Pseudomonas sp. RIT623 TaxID=2559075 RepID=UPI00106FBA77|nr:hypothetical protein [Pseudomonas sp. RIT623]TFF38139.1 hypothetical protein E3U47_16995 [Pseudomonas sp. RIT623]
MITVGGRKIIGSDNIIVPNGEEVVVTYKFDEADDVCISIVFDDLPDDEEKNPYLEVSGHLNKSAFKFRNFNSATGHSLGKPMVFAESDAGENISLHATVYKYKQSHRIAFQIMLGGDDE